MDPATVFVSGGEGRGGSFEVTVTKDGKEAVVYSKLATGKFPNYRELAKSIVG